MSPSTGGGRQNASPYMRALYVLAIIGVWVAIAFIAAVLVFSQGLPDISRLYTIQRQPAIAKRRRTDSGRTVAE